VIQPGTYQLTDTLYVKGPLSNVSIRGASNNRDDVVLVGKGMHNGWGADVPFGIWTGFDVDRVTIANLTIRDFWEHGIILNPNTQRPHIYNVRLLDIGSQFIKGNPDPSRNGVSDGRLEYSLIEYSTTSRDHYTNGIDIHAGWNWVIRRNVFRNITAPAGQLAGPAVLMWNRAGNTLTEGNLFINCARGIAYGLYAWGGFRDHTGGIIRNNMIFRAASQAGDVGIHVADSSATQILNNTVFLSGTYATPIEYRYPNSAGMLIINNLLDGTIWARDGASASLSNNITRANASLFVNAGEGDLHLVSSARSAIDAGLPFLDVPDDFDGTPRPVGSAPDIGADEFGGASTPPPPPVIPPVPPAGNPVPGGLYELVAGHSGQCLSVYPDFSNGATAVQWTCLGYQNQRWTLEPASGGGYQLVSRHSGLCLSADASGRVGTMVVQSTCLGLENQRWTLEPADDGNYSLRARHSGNALEVSNGSSRDGASLVQNLLTGAASQQWFLRPADQPASPPAPPVTPPAGSIIPGGLYELAVGHSGQCLSVYPHYTNGTLAVLWTCLGAQNQQWTLHPAGDSDYQLVARYSGNCLSADPSSNPGTTVVEWTCLGFDNQRWTIEPLGDGYYSLRPRQSSTVLDVSNGSSRNGAQILQNTVTGAASQQWFLRLVAAPSTSGQ